MAGSTSWRNVFFYGADDDWTNWTARKNNNPLIDRTPGFWIYPDNTTRLHYRHRAMTEGGFNDGIDVTDVAVLPAFAQWFHYSTTISGNQAKTYINGRLVASRTLGGNFEWNDMKPKKLRLGKDGISAGVYLQKLYWYNRVLTDAEVATLAGEIKYSYATGRYVRLQRKTWPPGGQVQGYLNILELAAYGTAGQVLPATPSLWPQYGGTGSFGPQFLADKITRADWWLGGAAGGLPHTTNHPQSYMELDLRGMQEVRSIVIENRRDCCTSRIIGTELQVLDANRRVVWSTMINNDQPTYRFTPQL
jgi:predicted DNA-binding protein (MmcQ/YjbR family)